MKKIKLSLCIATLNRADFIARTLDSIVPQIRDEIEIVIVDGASTDRTEEIVRSYQRTIPAMRYYKQGKNMGVDRDYNTAVELARGEYCWLMTDDDLLKTGAVSAVMDVLLRHDFPLVIVNAETRTKNLSRVIHANMLDADSDRIYSAADAQDFFIGTARYLSFIGAVVIRRALWLQRDKERYFGTAFIHMGVIFQKPIAENIAVLARPWIIIRYGNALWTPRKFEIWLFKWPRLIWSFDGFSDDAKRKIIAQKPWERLRTLSLFRAVGAFSVREYRALLKPLMDKSWRRYAARFVAGMPPAALNILWVVYISCMHRKSPMWLYDLKHSPYNYFRRLRKNGE